MMTVFVILYAIALNGSWDEGLIKTYDVASCRDYMAQIALIYQSKHQVVLFRKACVPEKDDKP